MSSTETSSTIAALGSVTPPLTTTSGFLEMVLGPVRSGKTTKLRSTLIYYHDLGFKVLLIAHSNDTRVKTINGESRGFLTTHGSGGFDLPDGIDGVKTNTLRDIPIKDYDIIGVDECQFFPDLYDTVFMMVKDCNKGVILAGLDGDSNLKPFGNMLDLLPLCRRIEKGYSICYWCRREKSGSPGDVTSYKAITSVRLSGDNRQVSVESEYQPACLDHYKLHCGNNELV